METDWEDIDEDFFTYDMDRFNLESDDEDETHVNNIIESCSYLNTNTVNMNLDDNIHSTVIIPPKKPFSIYTCNKIVIPSIVTITIISICLCVKLSTHKN
jgi:hypothetical protein